MNTMKLPLLYGWWFVLGVLLLPAAPVLGDPRPDFGLNGAVVGSVKAQTVASSAGANFDGVDEKTISIETHYTVLKTLEQDLSEIGAQIATAGQELTTQLETLALSNGPLPDVFDETGSALDALRDLLTTGLSAQTDSIALLVGNYITDMLTDASEELLTTLGTLEQQLGLLQDGIEAAVAAVGAGTPIPATTVRRYVSPKVTYALLRALHDLQAQVPLVTYIIELTLGHLETADLYLASVMERATGTVYDVIMLYDSFKREVDENLLLLGNDIATPLRLSYTAQLDALDFIRADLEQMESYEVALGPAFEAFEAALDGPKRDELGATIEGSFDDYLSEVVALDNLIDRFYDEKLCLPTHAVLQVLIASGPWADYCFSKYSPRLSELLSVNVDRFQMCYELEADRLERLYVLARRLTQQILFDVDGFDDDILACFYRIERGSDCIALVGPYYIELATGLLDKQSDLTNLIEAELKASAGRMAACVAGGKCGLLASAEDIVDGIQACETDGPLAVDS